MKKRIDEQRERFGPKIPVYDINDAGRKGGVVLRRSAVRIACLYGGDVGSWNIPGGCNEALGWCDAYVDEPLEKPCKGRTNADAYGCNCCVNGGKCNGQAIKPWRGEHVRTFLEFCLRYGGHAACCGSGYNEVILAGGKEWNEALPTQIEAFFYDKVRRGEANWGGGGGAPGNARRVRDGFVKRWGLRKEDVPLLMFDRSNYAAPFSMAEAPIPPPKWG